MNISRFGVLILAVLALASGACGDKKAPAKTHGTTAGGGTPGALPAGWQKSDVGSVGQSGDAGYASGLFTVSGSGQDIWDAADGFQFAWQSLTGDGTLTARVLTLDNTDAWAKAGVMIRETLNADSTFAMTVVTPSNGMSLQSRSQTAQGCSLAWGPANGAPYWVRISRSGNTITASTSPDGATWTPIADVTISMNAAVYVGLCVTAHNNSLRATATFDSVTLTFPGGAPGAPVVVTGSWLGQDIGAVGQAGNATSSGGTFTIGASGADIWGGADAFYYVYQGLSGDGEITARVASLDNTDAWAKSGVMIRESLNADSAFAMTVVTPSNGTTLQHRTSTGAGATMVAGPVGAAPRWVRLSRSGGTFTGYVSGDGSSWSTVGTIAIGMANSVYVGLCVTAHNNSAKAFSSIDSVTIGSPSTPPPPPPTGTVTIGTPISRIVYQRNNSNQAFIPLRGTYTGAPTRVEARALARTAGQGTDTAWTVVDNAPSGGNYRGSLTVQGGWYSLEVRAMSGASELGTASVDRVGAGEVFVVVGHSVAAGGTINIEGSTDERGNTIPDNRSTDQHNLYNDTADPQYLPPVVFSQYSNGVVPAPFGGGTYFWAKLAQYVAQNQNVPVIVYNAAFGGTSLEHWAKSSQGIPFDHSFVKSSIRMPYINLYNTLKYYINHTGMRAVLADQGQNDWPNQDFNQVFGYYQTWVNQARADLGYGPLAIVVNRATAGGNPIIRQMQEAMISQVPNCFAGPDYDTMAPGDRYDGIHLSEQGCWVAAHKWADALNGAFFANSQPYLPTFP